MSMVWRCQGREQILQVMDAALAYMAKYRQLDAKATEAGGQLFGTVSADSVSVVKVTGPYAGDDRTRYRYRSDPRAAQRAITVQARAGLLYLGEWHTHAEDHPTPSTHDTAAIISLRERSTLNTTSMLLVIVGRTTSPDGLRVCSFSGQGKIDWFHDNQPPAVGFLSGAIGAPVHSPSVNSGLRIGDPDPS